MMSDARETECLDLNPPPLPSAPGERHVQESVTYDDDALYVDWLN